jgi:hypothetical protein
MGSQFVDHTEMASKASVSKFVAIQEEHRFGVEYELDIWFVVTAPQILVIRPKGRGCHR